MTASPGGPARDDLTRLRLLSAVVETSEDAILTKDPEGIIQSWNRSAEVLYGWSAAEAIGQHISLIVPEDRREELSRLMVQVRQGQSVEHIQTVRVGRDGRRIDVSLSLSPVDLGSQVRGIAAIARDITLRSRQEERVRRSEERLNTIIESLMEGLVVADLDGNLLHWNRAALAMHGLSSVAEVQRPLEWFTAMFEIATLDGGVLPVEQWPLARVIRGEQLHDLPLRVRRTDIGRTWILSYSGTTVTEPGGSRLAVVMINDITERRAAEDRFRQVFEACPAGMLVVDGGGRIVMVNQELERMFGRAPGELIGLGVEELLPDQLREAHQGYRAVYQVEPAKRKMGGRKLRGRRADGSDFPVEVGLNPLAAGAERTVLAVVTDVTEQEAAARALARHQRELERSNRELAQFAYVASHDLQEPLRMVASYTELFSDRYRTVVDAKGEKYIGYILDGAHRMQALVRDLLGYARVDSAGKPLTTVRPQALLDAVLHDLSRRITESGATVDIGELPAVWADPGQFQELLQNLLSNAIKFRSERPLRITIEAERDGAVARFAVRDTGIGIEPGGEERIFAMFQRLHGRDKYEGSGIGLAIARKIVERHGGRIWIDSPRTVGTTVYFTLWPAEGPRPEPILEATQ